MGPRSRVSKETLKILISPSRNPVRNQLLEAQIEYYNIKVGPRQLKRRFGQDTKGAQRFKMAYTQSILSWANLDKRVAYSEKYIDEDIQSFY